MMLMLAKRKRRGRALANCYRDARVGDTAAEYGMQTGSESLALLAASKTVAGGLPAHFTKVIIVIAGVGPRTPIHHNFKVRRLGPLYRNISSPLCWSCSFGPHFPPPFAALPPRGRAGSRSPQFESAPVCGGSSFFILVRRRALPPRCAPGTRPALHWHRVRARQAHRPSGNAVVGIGTTTCSQAGEAQAGATRICPL